METNLRRSTDPHPSALEQFHGDTLALMRCFGQESCGRLWSAIPQIASSTPLRGDHKWPLTRAFRGAGGI